MKIRTKLVSVFCLSMVLMGAALVAEKVAVSKNDDQLKASEKRHLSNLIADEFLQSSKNLTRLARTYVATGDQAYQEKYWQIVQWRSGDIPRPAEFHPDLYPGVIKPQADIMKDLNFTDAEFALLKEAGQLSNDLIRTEEQAMNSIKQGIVAAGPYKANSGESIETFAIRILFDANYHREVTKIMGPVDLFFAEIDQRTAAELKAAQTSANFWMNTAFTFQLLVCAALIAVIFMTLRFVLTPLNQVVEAMREIGEGDGNLGNRLEEKGNDELTDLARSFNLFAANVMAMVQQVGASVENISSSSSQLASTAEKADYAINQQKMSIDQVSSASHQMVAAVQEVARHATSAAAATNQSDTEASQGMRVLDNAIQEINVLTEEIHQASGAIGQLESDSNTISTVLDVIRDIADQTNLLALNAAIEAARAGEQGRGFAVVADEVRNLAQRTQDSTQEIQGMIERLQSSAMTAVNVMQRSQDQAKSCVTQAVEAGTSLQSITQAISSINDMNNQIATASEQQGAVMEEISTSIMAILTQVDETSEGSRNTAVSSDSMRDLSMELKALVGQFKVA
ncbi:methyl-accepting chemotaxis protein [Aliamphritea ceti]|uniref:methyl-accepting chemotaxis protein n=1 Tax=Aliamphritea ceti TaxID=1524258 RepID=UPI0021C35CD5|nr:methyl-accepting chemotaxis protein [Aliamphritea ceti]